MGEWAQSAGDGERCEADNQYNARAPGMFPQPTLRAIDDWHSTVVTGSPSVYAPG